jgi:hypothetical protein
MMAQSPPLYFPTLEKPLPGPDRIKRAVAFTTQPRIVGREVFVGRGVRCNMLIKIYFTILMVTNCVALVVNKTVGLTDIGVYICLIQFHYLHGIALPQPVD